MKMMKPKLFMGSVGVALSLLLLSGCQTLEKLDLGINLQTLESVEKEYYECVYNSANRWVGKGVSTEMAVDKALQECTQQAQTYGEYVSGSVGGPHENRYDDSRTYFKPKIESQTRRVFIELIERHRV